MHTKLNITLFYSNFGWEYFLFGFGCKQPRWRRGMSKKYYWSCKSRSFTSDDNNNNGSKCIKVLQYRGKYNKKKTPKMEKQSETSCLESWGRIFTCHMYGSTYTYICVCLYLRIFVEFQPSQFPNDDSTSLWTFQPTTRTHTHTHTFLRCYWLLLLLLHSYAIFPSISRFASATLPRCRSSCCCHIVYMAVSVSLLALAWLSLATLCAMLQFCRKYLYVRLVTFSLVQMCDVSAVGLSGCVLYLSAFMPARVARRFGWTSVHSFDFVWSKGESLLFGNSNENFTFRLRC